MRKGLILTAGLWLAACTPKTESVCGVYQGTLPAADAPGIETTLTFGEDNQVLQRLVYIGKRMAFYRQGNFFGGRQYCRGNAFRGRTFLLSAREGAAAPS